MTASLPNSQPEGDASAAQTQQFRRLKANELVGRGDFVADAHGGFEPWEGPTGFRADAFVKPIYRKQERSTSDARKTL